MRYLKLIYVIIISSLLIFQTLSLPRINATSACEGRSKDPNALLRIFHGNGKFIEDYEFDYVSNWCVAENVLLSYSDTEILVQTDTTTFSVFDVSDLANNHELQEVNKFETDYSGYKEMAIINNSILHWRNGPEPNYVLHDLGSGQVSGLPLELGEIEANKLTGLFASLKYDDNYKRARLIATTNYNNWVAYGFHDSQDMQNDDINRNFIIHTGNQTISKTLFVENLTSFVPNSYSLSKDGETLVLSTEQENQGFVTYNLFTNQSWVYTGISNEHYATYVYGISVGITKVWFIEYNGRPTYYSLNQMALDTGIVSSIKIVNLPDAISGFTVVNGFIFVLTNSEISYTKLLLLIIGIITIPIIILILLKWKHK